MKTFLASLLLVSTLAPLVPVADAMDVCDISCIVDLDRCSYTTYGTVCYTVTADCVGVAATVYGRTYTVYQYVAGQTVTTTPVNVGPVHVSSVTVSTDPVYVGPYTVNTPPRNVSNTFCTSEFLA